MKPAHLFPLLLLALTIPARGQAKPETVVDSLLKNATERLDDYQQISANVRCDDETQEVVRHACEGMLETLAKDVQDAHTNIAHYNQTSETVDLFDTYETFHRIMEHVEILTSSSDSSEVHDQRNHDLFAQAYNNFVKLTLWFGGVVRDQIQQANKCSANAEAVGTGGK